MHFRNSHRIKYQECQILLSWFVGYRKGLTYSASIIQMLRSRLPSFPFLAGCDCANRLIVSLVTPLLLQRCTVKRFVDQRFSFIGKSHSGSVSFDARPDHQIEVSED